MACNFGRIDAGLSRSSNTDDSVSSNSIWPGRRSSALNCVEKALAVGVAAELPRRKVECHRRRAQAPIAPAVEVAAQPFEAGQAELDNQS